MGKIHTPKNFALIVYLLVMLFVVASCKKDSTATKVTPPPAPTPLKIGMDEYYLGDSTVYKILAITIQQIGTKTIDEDLIFDTGSGGLVIDGNEIVDKSMITSSGFNFTGDSTIVDGITITNQTSKIQYGDDDASTTNVYGNLAYAPVTIGQPDGSFIVKRLPFFIYYKATDGKNNAYSETADGDLGYFDIFGVSTQNDLTFGNNVTIQSPFSYYEPGTGLTKGFKMPALGTNNFSFDGNHVAGLITLGLTSADLSSTSGFSITNITNDPRNGYVPLVNGTITYNGNSATSYMLFDTGSEPYNIIEDKNGPATSQQLPSGSAVSVTTTSGFNFKFTTTPSEYLTSVENPNTSGADVSIFGIEFFLTNSYLLDYTDHLLGVKNN